MRTEILLEAILEGLGTSPREILLGALIRENQELIAKLSERESLKELKERSIHIKHGNEIFTRDQDLTEILRMVTSSDPKAGPIVGEQAQELATQVGLLISQSQGLLEELQASRRVLEEVELALRSPRSPEGNKVSLALMALGKDRFVPRFT